MAGASRRYRKDQHQINAQMSSALMTHDEQETKGLRRILPVTNKKDLGQIQVSVQQAFLVSDIAYDIRQCDDKHCEHLSPHAIDCNLLAAISFLQDNEFISLGGLRWRAPSPESRAVHPSFRSN